MDGGVCLDGAIGTLSVNVRAVVMTAGYMCHGVARGVFPFFPRDLKWSDIHSRQDAEFGGAALDDSATYVSRQNAESRVLSAECGVVDPITRAYPRSFTLNPVLSHV